MPGLEPQLIKLHMHAGFLWSKNSNSYIYYYAASLLSVETSSSTNVSSEALEDGATPQSGQSSENMESRDGGLQDASIRADAELEGNQNFTVILYDRLAHWLFLCRKISTLEKRYKESIQG